MVTISSKQSERDNVYNTLLLFYELQKMYVPKIDTDVYIAYYIDLMEFQYRKFESFNKFLETFNFTKKDKDAEPLFEGAENEFFSLENMIIISRAINRLVGKNLLENNNAFHYRITSQGIELIEEQLQLAGNPSVHNILNI